MFGSSNFCEDGCPVHCFYTPRSLTVPLFGCDEGTLNANSALRMNRLRKTMVSLTASLQFSRPSKSQPFSYQVRSLLLPFPLPHAGMRAAC